MNPRTYRAAVHSTWRPPPITLAGTSALLILLMLACAPAGAAAGPAGAVSPLPASDYTVHSVCTAPAPGYAGCLGLRLMAKRPLSLRGARALTRTPRTSTSATRTSTRAPQTSTSAPRATGPAVEQIEYEEPWEGSLSPQNVLTAYGLSGVSAPANRQTLALVDAFDDPTAEHDLKVFDEQFGLPPCTTANECFTKVAIGSPVTEPGWAQETATDIEVAHGLCPSCKILLVEAHSNSNPDLEAAEAEAERLGATEISNSWGGPEQGVTAAEDDTGPFNHPGTVITVAAGDTGYLDWAAKKPSERGFADYPASSPHVIAVGGTRLSLTAGGTWREETVWNSNGAGGGGCSTVLAAPVWQRGVAGWSSVGCSAHRAVADVSADADPYTGVAVYDSTPITEGEVEYRGWVPIGGTSVASPIIAATFALAGGAGKNASGETIKYPAQTLYENLAATPGALHDVVSGSNGACGKGFNKETGESGCSILEESASCAAKAICLAGNGYDGPTGVGTPNGIAAFKPTEESQQKATEKRLAEEKLREEQRHKEQERTEERLREAKKNEEATGPGGSPGGGSGGSGESGQGGSVAPPSSVSLITGPVPAAGSLGPPSTSAIVPILSAPALTKTATAALSHGRPKASRIAFAFTLNVATRVQVKLAKQIFAQGRKHWQTLPYSRTIAGRQGRNGARLSAGPRLAPGRYRLTLTPVHGTARTLTFTIG